MTDSTSLDRLRAQVEFAPSWRPDPGDTLVGTAIAWSSYEKQDAVTGETKACEILAVKLPDGSERAIWTWHAILRAELVGKVEPGDLVAISYVGRKPRQSGEGSYHHYRIAIEQGDHETADHSDDDIGF